MQNTEALSKYTKDTSPPYHCKHRGCTYHSANPKAVTMHYQRAHGASRGSPYEMQARKLANGGRTLATRNLIVAEAPDNIRRNKNGAARKPWGSNRKAKPVDQAAKHIITQVVENRPPVTAKYCPHCGGDLRGVNLALTHLTK